MTLGLHEALLELEVSAVEGGGQVVGLKDDGVVADVVVEVNYFVVLGEVERVLDQISLVAHELHVGDLYVVNEANDLVKDLILGLAESAQVNRCVDACICGTIDSLGSSLGEHANCEYCSGQGYQACPYTAESKFCHLIYTITQTQKH